MLDRLEMLRMNYGLKAGYRDAMTDAIGEVSNALTIDAVQVVRCKDCIYRDQSMRCIALYYGFNPCDEWFCANGARMDEKENN